MPNITQASRYIIWAMIEEQKKFLTDIIETGTSRVFTFTDGREMTLLMDEDNAFNTTQQIRKCDSAPTVGYVSAPLNTLTK